MAPKQGIPTILNSRSDTSITRTFSADMSSTKWLHNNGMKKILSSHELGKFPTASIDSSSSDEDEFENTTHHPWNDHYTLPKPYLAFTDRSLQACTESLGSESGSDCFAGDTHTPPDDRPRKQPLFKPVVVEEVRTPPPPLRSIVCGGDSLRIESRRENGRLVMEAVTVPPRNYFRAHRGNGRLVLSLIRNEIGEGVGEKEDGYVGDEEESIPPVVEGGLLISPARGMTRAHRPGAVMEKLLAMMNQDPTRPDEEEEFQIAKSLPPLVVVPSPRTVFDVYGYIWRKRTVGFVNRNPNYEIDGGKRYENQNTTNMNPYLRRGCKGKETRIRWFDEPFCIATS